MKTNIFSAIAFSSLLLASCGETAEKEVEVTETPEVETAMYTADVESTDVNWKGEVAGVYGHEGFVNLKSGGISLQDGKIVGGVFVVDMTGIYPTDSASFKDEDGRRISDLQNHLATTDFFNTAEFPTATFKITSVEGNNVTGDFTVRGKTNQETLEVSNLEVTDSELKLTGKLVFDRQKYDVAWVHFMKDMVLSDDIVINVKLVATK